MFRHRLSPSGPFLGGLTIKSVATIYNEATITLAEDETDQSVSLPVPDLRSDDKLLVTCGGSPETADDSGQLSFQIVIAPPSAPPIITLSPVATQKYVTAYGLHNLVVPPIATALGEAGTHVVQVLITAVSGAWEISAQQLALTVIALSPSP